MKLPIILAVSGIAAIASVAGIIILQDKIKEPSENPSKPSFVLDSAKTPGWWTSGNNWSNANEFTDTYTIDKTLPVVSISIHQGRNKQDIINGHCFVMYSYFDHTVDPKVELEKKKNSMVHGKDAISIKEVGVKSIKMHTSEGVKEYQFHEHELSSEDNEEFMRGMAVGYVLLKSGYIDIQSVCEKADQLDETLPILKAVSLAKQS